ncbi:Tol-Pal system beta propeller repeat protein TolB [Mergibacter septicus]|uniref:Tol-Pal system protein TolB n=1 Tax=Mergibacter septicus TaxID=221402 RepID=A0A8E3MF23_9PAST|nr:Tol-Pal system beta propeller repeat protein TolB [Mergibacter septicus]AWX14772.1 Tol-Pal system beta propeller repeat protein TolB [Mergibacter septicus]QDJ14023.1 Tol-Pal system beta propeller repeat protein TolB [Mergibacter septicus]UTU48529.1 Tol-Pal system protein TolB [Mergibacter septicus]
MQKRKFKQILAYFLGLLFLISFSQTGLANVRIVIDEGVDSTRPIAIIPFKWNGPGEAPMNIATIIADDLRNSGKFNPIPTSSMPQLPTTAAEVTPNVWAKLGIDAIVIGEVTPENGQFKVSYQLIDTIGATGQTGAILSQNSFTTSIKWLRWAAHTISDYVFERLTGIRGAFRTRIAYVVQLNSGDYDLRVADYDGYNQATIFHSNQPIMSPAWSADGKKIAYSIFENHKSLLVLQDISNRTRKVIAALPGHNGAPAFSPDNSLLAFSSNKDGVLNIYLTDINGNNLQQLTQNAGNNTEPSWSPDSQSILFTSDRSGTPSVYMMNKDGSNIQLISPAGRSYSGEISPDGSEVIMINQDHLIKKDLTTGNIQALTSTFLDESPSFSPNGIMILYSSTQGVGKVLQLVSSDGRFKARLPGNGQIKFPAWSPYLTHN